jgi:hypothetical protein
MTPKMKGGQFSSDPLTARAPSTRLTQPSVSLEEIITDHVPASTDLDMICDLIRLSCDETEQVKFIEDFNAAYAARNLLQAQAILEAADDDADVPEFYKHNWRGLLALAAHLLMGSEILFRRALKCARTPRQAARALVNLAAVELERRQLNKAEALCGLALGQDLTCQAAWVNLLVTLLQQGNAQAAQQALKDIDALLDLQTAMTLRWHFEHDPELEGLRAFPEWHSLRSRLRLKARAVAS